MQSHWIGRSLTWLALAESVRANRAAFPTLPTAWLPHGVGNSVLLWLPELLAALERALDAEAATVPHPDAHGIVRALRVLCVDNPRWWGYVAPSALGYALSHPRFNIYKGELGALRLGGFGLDAIPHSLTAFAVTWLVQDGVRVLAQQMPPAARLAPLARALAAHPRWASALLLALLSAIWESGEFMMQQDELRRAGGDRSRINMEWDVEDTLYDLLANTAGWALAAWQAAHHPAPHPRPATA